MSPAPSLGSLFDEAVLLLRVAGIRLTGTRELPNGIQATFRSPAGASCRCNFYYSERKGLTAVPAGGDAETSRRVAELLGGSGSPGGEGSRIGSDEAGKGDYMGPLTVAAVFADPSHRVGLRTLGAVDSKRLTDPRIRLLAGEIRRVSPGLFSVVSVMPGEYNRRMTALAAEGRNSLDLLAACHAEAIDALLTRGLDPDRVVIDRFCPVSRMKPLLRQGRFRLEMPVGGESDPVVAAASILARDAYLEGLESIRIRWGIRAVAGAGAPTDHVAREFVSLHGRDVLDSIAKLHFRNTGKILGPES